MTIRTAACAMAIALACFTSAVADQGAQSTGSAETVTSSEAESSTGTGTDATAANQQGSTAAADAGTETSGGVAPADDGDGTDGNTAAQQDGTGDQSSMVTARRQSKKVGHHKPYKADAATHGDRNRREQGGERK